MNGKQLFVKVLGKFFYLQPNFIKNKLEKTVFLPEDDNLPTDGPCDIGIVFGGRGLMRAERALEGYEDGVFDKIILAGGVGVLSENQVEPEAKEMEEYLVKKGVPDDMMLIETGSKNTIENVRYSLELMKEAQLETDKLRICVVSSDFHLRRCVGLLGTALGSYKNIYWMSEKFDRAGRKYWQKTPEGCFLIAKEAFRLWQLKLYGLIKVSPAFKKW